MSFRHSLFLACLLFTTLTSCVKCVNQTASSGKEPSISSDSLISILVDIHLVEAALQRDQMKLKDTRFYADYYYTSVFKKHHISKEDFHATMDYYDNHLEELETIYKEVVNQLSRIKGAEPGEE